MSIKPVRVAVTGAAGQEKADFGIGTKEAGVLVGEQRRARGDLRRVTAGERRADWQRVDLVVLDLRCKVQRTLDEGGFGTEDLIAFRRDRPGIDKTDVGELGAGPHTVLEVLRVRLEFAILVVGTQVQAAAHYLGRIGQARRRLPVIVIEPGIYARPV